MNGIRFQGITWVHGRPESAVRAEGEKHGKGRVFIGTLGMSNGKTGQIILDGDEFHQFFEKVHQAVPQLVRQSRQEKTPPPTVFKNPIRPKALNPRGDKAMEAVLTQVGKQVDELMDGVNHLTRVFRTPDFARLLVDFVNDHPDQTREIRLPDPPPPFHFRFSMLVGNGWLYNRVQAPPKPLPRATPSLISWRYTLANR